MPVCGVLVEGANLGRGRLASANIPISVRCYQAVVAATTLLSGKCLQIFQDAPYKSVFDALTEFERSGRRRPPQASRSLTDSNSRPGKATD